MWTYTMFFIFSTIFTCVLLISMQNNVATKPSVNNRPIIGVLSQETHASNVTNYIAASYVKFLEGAGARVIPIMVNQNRSYYKKIFNSINGALFPGGARDLDSSSYEKAGKTLYRLAEQANKRGDYFPLWGTCLGFQLLVYVAAGKDIICECNGQNMALPLQFTKDFKKSRMFSEAPDDIINILMTKPVTGEFHHHCVTVQNFTASGLDKTFRITSVNNDANNITYISAMESRQFPFYGVQFHPEKNLYEWTQKAEHNKIPHTFDAVRVSQFFSNFFINEARKNFHKFKDEEEEKKYLIYNYNPRYTDSIFEQIYFFKLNKTFGIEM